MSLDMNYEAVWCVLTLFVGLGVGAWLGISWRNIDVKRWQWQADLRQTRINFLEGVLRRYETEMDKMREQLKEAK